MPFDVVPGMPADTAVPTYAGVALGPAHTSVDITAGEAVDYAALAVAPGPLVLQATAAELAGASARLVENGWKPGTPALVTAGGTGSRQRTVETSLDKLAADGAGLEGPLVVTLGDAVTDRATLSWWESRALYGWRVLVPRTKDQAGAMSDRLRVHGAVPEEVPTIAVEPPRSPAQMERAVKGLVDGRYQWVVFTSANAVRAVWEKFGEFGLDARAFSGVRIACVGEATADVVRSFGVHPSWCRATASSPPRACSTCSRRTTTSSTRWTASCSRGPTSPPRPWPRACSSAAGRSTTSPRTAPSGRRRRRAGPRGDQDGRLRRGVLHLVVDGANLVGIAGKPHARTIVACIGPKTAETAVEFGLRVDVKPDTADVPSLVEALASHANKLRRGGRPAAPRRAEARKR